MSEGLSDSERAELEALRKEKALREQAAKEQAERAELDRLRRERDAAIANAAAEKERLEREEKARQMMEPDEDLRMPVVQKVLIGVLAVVFVLAVVYMFILPS